MKLIFLSLALVLLTVSTMSAQKSRVTVLEIKATIDPPMKRYVEVGMREAERNGSDIVIIEMDTYGGVLTDAKEIVDILMRFPKPVWVFINSDAASAGALISIACDSIYMAPGATIGAATVVSGTGEKAPDKYQSYMRSIMRSTATENNRNPRIAEAMVDESIAIDSITVEGQVITFSTDEAMKYGFCEAKVKTIREVLERNGVKDYELIHFELSGAEKIIGVFLNPFISSILILVIIGGLYFELQTPGVGFPGLAAAIALILYLVPYYLSGLAANWEIIAFFIGIILIALEVFVIPGFGIAGIAGIGLTVVSLVLIMINNDAFDFEFVPTENLFAAVLATLTGLLGGIILLFVGGSRLADSRFFKKVALTTTQERSEGYTSSFFSETMKGKTGLAHTVLRPGGKVNIEGRIYDAYTQGEYIDRGEAIEVIGEETTSLRVRKIPSTT